MVYIDSQSIIDCMILPPPVDDVIFIGKAQT